MRPPPEKPPEKPPPEKPPPPDLPISRLSYFCHRSLIHRLIPNFLRGALKLLQLLQTAGAFAGLTGLAYRPEPGALPYYKNTTWEHFIASTMVTILIFYLRGPEGRPARRPETLALSMHKRPRTSVLCASASKWPAGGHALRHKLRVRPFAPPRPFLLRPAPVPSRLPSLPAPPPAVHA